MLLSLHKWLENHQLPCFYKNFLGIKCPGCGLQQSFILLIKGEIKNSFFTYPPLFLIIILLLALMAQIIFKFEKGGIYLKYLYIFTAITIVANYIIILLSSS